MSARTISKVWDDVAAAAGVEDKTPHSARQLGHKKLNCSLQYARMTAQQLADVLDERE